MNVGIIGAGTMGVGIAQVVATAGCKVVVFDANALQIDKALLGLEKTLQKLVEKNKLSQEKANEIRSNITKGSVLQDLKDAQEPLSDVLARTMFLSKIHDKEYKHIVDTLMADDDFEQCVTRILDKYNLVVG